MRILFVFIFMISFKLDSQILFQQTYGTFASNESFSISEDGNGFLVCGWYDVTGAFNAELFLMKIDSFGDTMWSKTYGERLDTTANKIKHFAGNVG